MGKKKNEITKTAWPFKDAIWVFLGFVTINLLLLIFSLINAEHNIFSFLLFKNKTLSTVLLYILSAATFLTPLWFFLIKGKKIRLKDFGLRKITILEGIKTVLIGYGLLICVNIILILIMTYLQREIPGLSPQADVLPIFGEGALAITVAGVIAIGIAPIVEEIFFRGYLLQSLMSKYSFLTASIVTSAIFSFVHFQFESILGIFILSMIINYLYKRSGNRTTATILFHMVNNAVAVFFILNIDKILPAQS